MSEITAFDGYPALAEASHSAQKPALEGASPFLAQYLAIKAEHQDYLLFFRMGDFYELFFEDAVVAAAALGIALTKRGRHKDSDIPMCGVPVHASDTYLARLVRQGHKVAICEQIESPAEAKKRGSKTVVERAVIRIVTPGTLSEDTLLEANRHNYLAALARLGEDQAEPWGLAYGDISTGDCYVLSGTSERIAAALLRLAPQELLVPDTPLGAPAIQSAIAPLNVTPRPSLRFQSAAGARSLASIFGVATLDGFGHFTRAELGALGALFDYVGLTQKSAMPQMKPPRREESDGTLMIDAATQSNLELLHGTSGEREGSVLAVLDETATSAGARLLRARLMNPSTKPDLIAAWLDAVSFFHQEDRIRTVIRDHLARVPDFARAMQRLSLNRGGPRDLAAIRDGLREGGQLISILKGASPLAGLPGEITTALSDLEGFDGLVLELQSVLDDALPVDARDGGFVRSGFDSALDELRALRDESRAVILGLENRYRALSGVTSLKIRHNNVLGYFIEVTPAQGERMLADAQRATFIHRQTLVSGLRFTTSELSDIEQRIAQAGAQALERELELFSKLRRLILDRAWQIGAAADALSKIDVAASLGKIAQERQWSRPLVTQDRAFRISGGRHPVVEAALQRAHAGRFVPNDCDLSDMNENGRLWLVTGPNMAGKSTFLRQNALIAIMAQMGSFVPADRAEIGIVDRLFSRIGAADDLARGRSTFMVEMVETAAILNQATDRALVILDEIGRGTATYDGLSIAWASLEHLHEVNRVRGLFATHYHELTALTSRLKGLTAVTMRVKEWRGDVHFLHEVARGTADRSYGIHVAKLAGLPPLVIERARAVLASLEAGHAGRSRVSFADDLPLFAAAARTESQRLPNPLLEKLQALNPDELSARAALDLIYELCALARGEKT